MPFQGPFVHQKCPFAFLWYAAPIFCIMPCNCFKPYFIFIQVCSSKRSNEKGNRKKLFSREKVLTYDSAIPLLALFLIRHLWAEKCLKTSLGLRWNKVKNLRTMVLLSFKFSFIWLHRKSTHMGKTKFQTSWQRTRPWLVADKSNVYGARCAACNTTLNIQSGVGINESHKITNYTTKISRSWRKGRQSL